MEANLGQTTKQLRLQISTEKPKTEDTRKELEKFTDGFNKYWKEKWSQTSEDSGKAFAASIDKFGKRAIDGIKDFFVDSIKDAWFELSDMVSMSKLTNATTRNNAFTYGFSASESYGFEKAKDIMGLSDEDLMYMDPMQAQHFRNYMQKYTEKYAQLYDSGFFDKYLEFQYEMEDLKSELQMEIIDFFMDNKDLIKSGMEAILVLSKEGLQLLSSIATFLGHESAISSDSYVNNVTNVTNNNVSVDYNAANGDKVTSNSFPGAGTFVQLMQTIS